ncbi:MAG TPA: hypothetical protein VHU81_20025 [Thermoanaerobaculia bacterium]|nr:hypothetical protein [Thermoanaerobaculia bacterium]
MASEKDSNQGQGLSRRAVLRLAGSSLLLAGASGWLPRRLLAGPADAGMDAAQAASGGGSANGVLKAFGTPAFQKDFASNPALQAELDRIWSLNVNQWTQQAIVGNPWTSNYDSNRAFYFNPLEVPIPPNSPVKLVEWIAFPNRIQSYLGAPQYKLTEDQSFDLADNGRLPDGITLLPIPQNPCPFVDSNPSPVIPYGPAGPRGWQDEYCEWAIERDAAGDIVRVMFTCENPEYWTTIWNVDEKNGPEKVLELYRQLVSPRVQLDDLVLHDAQGRQVRDPNTGFLTYNPINKWNNTTKLLPDSGGAVHLTSPPNNLGAEIGLGAGATLLRFDSLDPQDLICCTPFGQSFRHSDPHIGFTINQAVRQLNMRITITNPVGLYIQTPDFESYELPADWIRQGLKPQDFWRLERGTPGMGLHAVFQAPEGRKDLKLNKIRIHGKPLRWGGQLTQTFQIGLRGVLIPPATGQTQTGLFCPNTESPAPDRPSPAQLLSWEVVQAFLANNTTGSSSTAAPRLVRGHALRDMALITTGTRPDTPIEFPGGGIHVIVKDFLENVQYHVPGNTNGGAFNIFILDIEADPSAPTGQRGLRLGTDFNPAAPAFLTVE